jgi:hypothetical protein
VQQDVCRALQTGDTPLLLPLDDMVLSCKVTAYESNEKVKGGSVPAADGVLVTGLVLEGADWSRSDRVLIESGPKLLGSPFPIIQVGAVSSKVAKARVSGPGQCCFAKFLTVSGGCPMPRRVTWGLMVDSRCLVTTRPAGEWSSGCLG